MLRKRCELPSERASAISVIARAIRPLPVKTFCSLVDCSNKKFFSNEKRDTKKQKIRGSLIGL